MENPQYKEFGDHCVNILEFNKIILFALYFGAYRSITELKLLVEER